MKTKNKRKLALMILFIMVLQVILPLCSINTNVVEAADINEEQMVIDLYNALEKIELSDFDNKKFYIERLDSDNNKYYVTYKKFDFQTQNKQCTRGVYWVKGTTVSLSAITETIGDIREMDGVNEGRGSGYIYLDSSVKKLTGSFASYGLNEYDDQTNGLLGGNGLTSIPKNALQNNNNMSYIIGFKNVETISEDAFKGMDDLKYVYRIRQIKEN